MFGFLKKAASRPTPRAAAVEGVCVQLANAAAYLSGLLAAEGIDCVHLGSELPMPHGPVAAPLLQSLRFTENGQPRELRLGFTDDHRTFSLEPHYRLLEIVAQIEDIEAARRADPAQCRALVQRQAPHALLQSRLLGMFLMRVPAVAKLLAEHDEPGIDRELAASRDDIAGISARLAPAFFGGSDRPTLCTEWIGWPYIEDTPAT